MTFVPRNRSDSHLFHTIAFTRIPGDYKTELERRSCAFDDCGVDGCQGNDIYQALVVKDVGRSDGIEKILFAFKPLQHWSTSLLLSDAIRHLLKDVAVLEYGEFPSMTSKYA